MRTHKITSLIFLPQVALMSLSLVVNTGTLDFP